MESLRRRKRRRLSCAFESFQNREKRRRYPHGYPELVCGLRRKLYQAFLFEDRWKLYLDGLGVTLGITLGAILISTVLGMVLCLMKLSKHAVLRGPAKAYIDVIRGVPVVVQLLIMYNVVLLNVTDNKMVVAIIAFGLNSSAYMAEIYRSGINAVDQGQMEAGRSLGLTKVQTMWHIIFPQALKNCLPTYTSEFIVLVKEDRRGGLYRPGGPDEGLFLGAEHDL